MKMHAWMGVLAGLAAWPAQASAQDFDLSPTFAGRAVALQITPWKADSLTLVDTGVAPTTGGQVERSTLNAYPMPGIVAHELYSVTSGAASKNRSQASLANLDLSLGSHRVTATWVESDATATAEFLNVPTSGKSSLDGLTVDGQPVAVTGAANQTITFADGYLIINEQSGSSSRHVGTLTVNALHLLVDGSGSAIVASSTAEVINAPTRTVGP